MDVDPVTKQVRHAFSNHSLLTDLWWQETMRFLAFDCLIVNDENVMDKTLDKRYGVRFSF